MTTPMAAHRRNARGPKLRLLPVLLKEHGASHKEIGRHREFVQRHPVAPDPSAAGVLLARGFHGDYGLTVESAGRRVERSFSLVPRQEVTEINITLP